MVYTLPKSVEIGGKSFEIRYDFRVILDIFEVLGDIETDSDVKAYAVLRMFYVDFESISDYDCALKECFCFINGGTEDKYSEKQPKLVSWSRDFPYIAAPVNRILGREIRDIPYDAQNNTGGLHWWTFLSAYMEIGDCLFAQIVRIREKKAKRKPLDKSDKEFYKRNRHLVDMKTGYTQSENELLKLWTEGER